jgi:hypothetical protein
MVARTKSTATSTANSSVSIYRALTDPKLLGGTLGDLSTWATWFAVLKATFNLPMTQDDIAVFAQVSGGREPPRKRVRELWAIISRRGAKTRMASAIAAFIATCIDHSGKLAAGEVGMILILAPTVAQAAIAFGYLRAFIERSPILAGLIEDVSNSEIKLRGNIVIACHPASYRTVRGRTLLAAVFDECAFWRDETSALPDVETYRAVLPSLATTNGMLIGVGSPYRKLGLLYTKHRDNFGKDDDAVLVVAGETELFNPTIDRDVIAQADRDDPAAALSEWHGQFRADLQSFLDDAAIDQAIDHGRPLELPPRPGMRYHAFTDASAGRHDQFTIAIVHRDKDHKDRVIADVIRGRKPPFDPNTVAKDYATLAKSYGCHTITGDAFAGEWTKTAFEKAGITYKTAERNRSELYLEALPLWSRGLVSIPNLPILVRELRLLERRTHRSGKDSVDHGAGAGSSDDHANSLFGALNLAVGKSQGFVIPPEIRARLNMGPRRAQDRPKTFFRNVRL